MGSLRPKVEITPLGEIHIDHEPGDRIVIPYNEEHGTRRFLSATRPADAADESYEA